MNYDLAQTSFVDQGRYAIHAQPSVTTGMLYFTRTPEATQVYRRDQVLGLRFRLSGGALPVTNDALLVTVVGSNARPYWVANDTSVSLDGRVIDEPDQNQPLFSETRLYFLDINHTIPAREWIEVEVLLDDLIYDPSYTYVTGFYFKTDKELLPSFYVDQVSLLLLANAGAGQ